MAKGYLLLSYSHRPKFIVGLILIAVLSKRHVVVVLT